MGSDDRSNGLGTPKHAEAVDSPLPTPHCRSHTPIGTLVNGIIIASSAFSTMI